MKFVNSDEAPHRRPYLLFSIIIVILLSCYGAKNLNVDNILERISNGELNEKDVVEFYKKDYDTSLELNEFFQPCLNHLIQEEKKKTNSFFGNLIGGVKNLFYSKYNELEFNELGIKIKCEVYVNNFINKKLREKNSKESNPLKHSLESCKKSLIKLEDENKNLKQITPKFNFKSLEESQSQNLITENIKKSQPDHISNKQCIEELSTVQIKLNHLEKENSLLERQLIEKNKIIQSKDDENCKNQETLTKIKLEIIEKQRIISEYQTKNVEIKSDLEKCKVTGGNGGTCAECEKKFITKIDEFTTCEKQKNEYFTKYEECSTNITKIKLQINSLKISIKENDKKIIHCENERKRIIKRLSTKESEYTTISEKSVLELADCKSQLKDKLVIITELNKKLNSIKVPISKNNPGTIIVNWQQQYETTTRELVECKEKQNNYVTIIEEKNKIIIKKNSEISTCEIEKNNIKTENDKNLETCKNEKIVIEKKVKIFEEKYSAEKNKADSEKNELKELKIYKRKYEKCEENGKREKKKYQKNIEKCKKDFIEIKTELEKTRREKKTCEDNKKIQISTLEKCEHEKVENINKSKECVRKIEENKTIIRDNANKCQKDIDVIKINIENKYKSEILIIKNKITDYEKQIQILRVNQNCPVNLTKCRNDKNIIENKIHTFEKEISVIKQEKTNFVKEIKKLKEEIVKIQTEENVCKISLEETKNHVKNCQSQKKMVCPKLDETQLIEIRKKYEKCQNEYNIFQTDFKKCNEKTTNLEILVKENQETKNKCVLTCPADLETCRKNKAKIIEKFQEDIKIKITEIETLHKQFTTCEADCKIKIKEVEQNEITFNRNAKVYRERFDSCESERQKEKEIKKKLEENLESIKCQFENCQKQKEISGRQKLNNSEKCEKMRQILIKENNNLKEKITKLQAEKKSIFVSSKNIIMKLKNQCEKDLNSYESIVEEMENRIKIFSKSKITIDSEIKNDEFIIMEKQKDIPIKVEERNIIINEITIIKQDYEKIYKEITILREDSKSITEIEKIRSNSDLIEAKEKLLKEKHDLLCQKAQKEKEISLSITIIEQQINNYVTIKNIRVQKIKEYDDIVQRVNNILINIKKVVEVKRITTINSTLKIDQHANIKVEMDGIIANLEKEKQIVTDQLRYCKGKIEEFKSENHLMTMKITNTVSSSLFSTTMLMKLFEERSLIDNHCERIAEFKKKFHEVCPCSGRCGKNTRIESKFPLTNQQLKIESKGKLKGFKLNSYGATDMNYNYKSSTSTPIESKVALNNSNLLVESKEAISGITNQSNYNTEINNNGNINIESMDPLRENLFNARAEVNSKLKKSSSSTNEYESKETSGESSDSNNNIDSETNISNQNDSSTVTNKKRIRYTNKNAIEQSRIQDELENVLPNAFKIRSE